jgi:CHC2 zinc finger
MSGAQKRRPARLAGASGAAKRTSIDRILPRRRRGASIPDAVSAAAMNLTLQEAKERVRISDLWREFGYEGEPKKQCRCPFHEDRTPSFSVFDEGRKWKCFSGCGEGSVIDFLVLAKGISEEEACKEVLRRADANDCSPPIRRESPRPKSLELPALFPYSKDIAQQVADSRGLSITALEFASLWLKTVVFGRVCDQDCWILTDASCRCGDARRIVREPFPPLGTGRAQRPFLARFE